MSTQINFRMNESDLKIAKIIAKEKGVSLAELARKALEEKLLPERLELAFNLLKDAKVGFKGAWNLSGLDYNSFMVEWARRGAVEEIPLEIIKKNLEKAKNIDWSSFLK